MLSLLLGWASLCGAQGEVGEGCPREALREMMTAAAEYGGIGDVAAIELEVLKLCVERQKLISDIVGGERELAGFRSKGRGEAADLEVEELPVVAAVAEDLTPPAKAGAAEGRENVETERFEVAVEAPRPRLRWMTVYGSAGEWVAGISDGVKIWYVREGDRLPSGVRVLAVRLSPPGVSVGLDGERWLIPGPGGGS